ncbi:MAG: efflux RND transporter periplasmic adaptor subunit [Terriglobia bacterium]
MKAKFARIITVAVLCLISGFELGCNQTRANQERAQAQGAANGAVASGAFYVAPGAEDIATMTIKPEPIPEYLDVPAQIQADPTLVVRVFTPAGGRITELKVRPWDHVVKGQTLAILDSNDLARDVADYHKALVDSRVKQEALARARFLFAHSAIARKDLQQAQGDAEMAQAEVQATRAQIQVFGMNPDDAGNQLRVVAPRSGVILDVGAAQGEFSNGMSAPQPLCTIGDLDTVWAVGDLLEKDFTSVKVGDPADLTLVALPGKTWKGRVSVISSTVDPITRTLRLRVVLQNEADKLRPDMFGTLRLVRARGRGVVVPDTAVLREGTASFVFVEQSAGHFDRRPVTLGSEVGTNQVEVTSGLKPGDTVVVEGADLLRSAAAGPTG